MHAWTFHINLTIYNNEMQVVIWAALCGVVMAASEPSATDMMMKMEREALINTTWWTSSSTNATSSHCKWMGITGNIDLQDGDLPKLHTLDLSGIS